MNLQSLARRFVAVAFGVAAVVPLAASDRESRCTEVAGESIRAADLARTLPVFRRVAPDQPIGFAPLPGSTKVLRREEVARLAKRFGIEAVESSGVCFVVLQEKLVEERIVAALRRIFPIADAKDQITVLDYSRHFVPAGRLIFPAENARRQPDRHDGSVLCRGRIEYGSRRSVPVWARVKITVTARRVVATTVLRQGQPIASGQVRLETTHNWHPAGATPFLSSLDEAVGMIPRRTLPAGSALNALMLQRPKDISAGDLVEVSVENGTARLRFTAKALGSGRRGESILLLNNSSGTRLSGRVEGRGEATVRLTGAASDAKRKNFLR
jgi:flagella basal body P-ring formation protein FlgA